MFIFLTKNDNFNENKHRALPTVLESGMKTYAKHNSIIYSVLCNKIHFFSQLLFEVVRSTQIAQFVSSSDL